MWETHGSGRRYEAVYAERERIVTGRMPGNRYEAHAHEMTRARIYVDHKTRVPAYSSTRTRLVWVSTRTLCTCCITYVLQHALDRTCCPRRAPAPQSKPRVHGLICTPRLRPLHQTSLLCPICFRAYCAQIGVLWMELLRLRDGGKSVKLGVDVSLALSDLVPTLRLKKRQCVRERAELGG